MHLPKGPSYPKPQPRKIFESVNGSYKIFDAKFEEIERRSNIQCFFLPVASIPAAKTAQTTILKLTIFHQKRIFRIAPKFAPTLKFRSNFSLYIVHCDQRSHINVLICEWSTRKSRQWKTLHCFEKSKQ